MDHRYADNMKNLLLLASVAILIVSTISLASDDEKLSYEKLLTETKSHIKKAQEVNGLWRDTEQLLHEAERLHKSGDAAAAIKLLNEVNTQARLGYQQANSQTSQELIPYYLQ